MKTGRILALLRYKNRKHNNNDSQNLAHGSSPRLESQATADRAHGYDFRVHRQFYLILSHCVHLQQQKHANLYLNDYFSWRARIYKFM